MGSKYFLLMKSVATLPMHKHTHLLTSCSYLQTHLLSSNSRKASRILASPKHFSPSYQRVPGYSYTPYSSMPNPTPINVGILEKQLVDKKHLMILKQELQEIGIDGSKCTPGQHSGLTCPTCKGGPSHEKSLSLNISEHGGAAKWTCFRAKCGWSGKTRAFADVNSTYATTNKMTKVKKQIRVINEESLELEPLGNEVAIAFPYRRNGELVSCKYRDISFTKRFWQESCTEKIFYGLDDIKGASDVIIVEGEMDKLSMEEAGFKNCVSVPDGAPTKASNKALPSEEEDTKCQYLWNCKDYIAKASRIILATDGDPPGQALAKELARRVGKERCWWVEWPKKDEFSSFKDANEVLKNLGAEALRDAIHNAKSYHMHNVD